MKYLSDYIEEAHTKALNNAGAFFAFSHDQFNRQKKEGIKYTSFGSGLICPTDKAEELDRELARIVDDGRAQDMNENGKKGIIHRELANHECCITHDISDTAMVLAPYGIMEKEIRAEVDGYLKAYYEWEDAQEKQVVYNNRPKGQRRAR